MPISPNSHETDPMAAVRAAQILTELPEPATLSRRQADDLVRQFGVRFEHHDGLRRVALTSVWEVDPSGVRAPTEPDEARLAAVAEAALSA